MSVWEMLKKKKAPFGGGDSDSDGLDALDVPEADGAISAIDKALADSKNAQEARELEARLAQRQAQEALQRRAEQEREQTRKEQERKNKEARNRCGCW